MEGWCQLGFTTKVIPPTPNYSGNSYLTEVLFDATNTPVDLGKTTDYFETIYEKTNCHIKECSAVLESSLVEDTDNAANFNFAIEKVL